MPAQWHSVRSCFAKVLPRLARKRRSASMAEVLPLLFAPTKSVVLSARSIRTESNLRKLAISR